MEIGSQPSLLSNDAKWRYDGGSEMTWGGLSWWHVVRWTNWEFSAGIDLESSRSWCAPTIGTTGNWCWRGVPCFDLPVPTTGGGKGWFGASEGAGIDGFNDHGDGNCEYMCSDLMRKREKEETLSEQFQYWSAPLQFGIWVILSQNDELLIYKWLTSFKYENIEDFDISFVFDRLFIWY